MFTTDILREAEADLAALASLPGEIRAKVKAGVAELTRLRDAIDSEVARLTGGATVTLEALRAPAPAPAAEAGPHAAGSPTPDPAAGTGAPTLGA